jgi:DNA-binding beta-propeller fold protein YncE
MFRRASFASLTSLFFSLAACTGATAGTSVATGTSFSGCGSPGANDNEQSPGDEPGGVSLDLGELAVAPSGAFVLFKSTSALMVGWPSSGSVKQLSIASPTKVAFSKQRTVVYVASADDSRLHAVDVALDVDLWSVPLGVISPQNVLVDASADDKHLVISASDHLTVVDAQTGHVVKTEALTKPIVDLRVLPDDARAIVVTQHTWAQDQVTPKTEIELVRLADGQGTTIDVPNCASPLAVTPDGRHAFLAPSFCNKDPISLIDLTPGQEGWVKNLPGFGPVALGPKGDMAVAFLDGHDIDETLFDDPGQIPPHGPNDPEFWIMTFDTKTLKYDFTAWGDSYPRYQLTPDGGTLLVDDPFGSSQNPSNVRLFDTVNHTFRTVKGPIVDLDDFAVTDDSKHVYTATATGLFDLDVTASTVTWMDVGYGFVQNLNISPDGQTLYLRKSATEICIYDIASQACTGSFVGPQTRAAGL